MLPLSALRGLWGQSVPRQPRRWRSGGQSCPPLRGALVTERDLFMTPGPQSMLQSLHLVHSDTSQSTTGKQ